MSTTLGVVTAEQEPEVVTGIDAITIGSLIRFFMKAYLALGIAALPFAAATLIIALVVSTK